MADFQCKDDELLIGRLRKRGELIRDLTKTENVEKCKKIKEELDKIELVISEEVDKYSNNQERSYVHSVQNRPRRMFITF